MRRPGTIWDCCCVARVTKPRRRRLSRRPQQFENRKNKRRRNGWARINSRASEQESSYLFGDVASLFAKCFRRGSSIVGAHPHQECLVANSSRHLLPDPSLFAIV